MFSMQDLADLKDTQINNFSETVNKIFVKKEYSSFFQGNFYFVNVLRNSSRINFL